MQRLEVQKAEARNLRDKPDEAARTLAELEQEIEIFIARFA